MYYIQADLSKKILTIGPDYKDHRGGIGAVIETYNSFFEDFNFIPSYRPFKSNLKKVVYFVNQLIKIIRYLIKDKDIEIVHIHGSHGASLYRKFVIFLVSKYTFKRKVIYHIHSSSYDVTYRKSGLFRKYIINSLINNSDLIICLSGFWLDFFKNNFNPQKIIIINNVVNKPANKNSYDWDKGSVTKFLFLGRVGDRKGIFDLLHVLSNKSDFYREKLKLYIGGDGEIDRLKAFIKTNNLEDFVEYVGWVTDERKKELLSTAEIYILPSYNEGLPISILEAMSYGLAVISTNVGGTPEILEDNVNGFIFNPGDLLAMDRAIRILLDNREKILKFGTQSLKKIKPYLPDVVAAQLTAIYKTLLHL